MLNMSKDFYIILILTALTILIWIWLNLIPVFENVESFKKLEIKAELIELELNQDVLENLPSTILD